ncbi:hypothetical protein D0525_16430 [Salmonella enterica]|nr:hypothetical protein D0525_16430 [Salmonella enterica]
MESWRDIVGYEGSYIISEFGQVRGLDRIDANGHNRKAKV